MQRDLHHGLPVDVMNDTDVDATLTAEVVAPGKVVSPSEALLHL
jgi:hypothetical protein